MENRGLRADSLNQAYVALVKQQLKRIQEDAKKLLSEVEDNTDYFSSKSHVNGETIAVTVSRNLDEALKRLSFRPITAKGG